MSSIVEPRTLSVSSQSDGVQAPDVDDAAAAVREESDKNDVVVTQKDTGGVRPENIRAVRLGHGANCSSVGSVIDTLFLSAAVGGAIFAAICAAMRDEPVRVVGGGGGGGGGGATPKRENAPHAAKEKDDAR